MAITENRYTGDGTTTSYSFVFPYIDETDIKITLDDVLTTAYSLANATTIQFDTAPALDVAIRIYRDTDDSANKATFFAGSAVRSQDLNDNFLQALYLSQEAATISTSISEGGLIENSITGFHLANDSVGSDQILAGAVDTAELADGAVTTVKLDDLAVTDAKIADASITGSKLANSTVTETKLGNDAVSTIKIVDSAVTTPKIADASVTSAKIADANVTTAKIADGAITTSKFAGGLSIPVGAVFYFAASTAPVGYLKANGDTIPNGSGTVQGVTADFSALYAIIGSTYGSAGKLPDLRGEFLRGWDDSAGVDSGRTFGSTQGQATAAPTTPFTTAAEADHNHTLPYAATSGGFGFPTYPTISTGPTGTTQISTSSAGAHNHSITGGGDPETRPRNIALLACIKY
jgi:microcystin-dependent protein